jgi:murein DD-endopeptidase / murein LD-carboxypeptidase
MNKSKLITVFLISVILASCGSSSKLLKSDNKILTEEIKSLKNENKKLNIKITSLENAIEELEEDAIVLDLSPTPPVVSNKKNMSLNSQLNEFENYIKSDANLSSKFKYFKKGGVEQSLKVSYADMQRVIKEAKTYKGTRHVMGGLSHSGIDCSGLLYVSFRANGITNIPRNAQDFARYGFIILNVNEIKAGDLVFFTNTYRTSKLVTHAGICIGNGEFIHTSSSKGVMISKINDPYYWRDKFLFGTRIVN